MKQLKWSGLLAMIFALSACGSSNHSSNSSTSAIDNGSDTVGAASRSPEVFPSGFDINHSESVAGPTLLSCSAEIGGSAATEKVAVCRNVSPATHPPCNVANSCAMIDDEIARSCALFDGKGSPMAGCTPSPKSPQAAIAVIERYYSAINAHDYGTAWAQWGESGPSGQSREKFEKGYALTRKTKVTIGRLVEGDAGAGSLFQPVPVTVDAAMIDGSRQRYVGEYVIRRVNDVDGASAAQLRWHIGSAKLRRIP